MKADNDCFTCCRSKAAGLLVQHQATEETTTAVMELIDGILEEAKRSELTAPDMMAEVLAAVESRIDISDAYAEAKQKYNRLLLERETALYKEVREAKEPFLAGIQCAIAGNYIDFGAMSEVKEEKLNELLKQRTRLPLNDMELRNLKNELKKAGKLVYITDNAGEIVLDKIFIRILKECYPDLEVTVLVRGYPVLNDATQTDAEAVGMAQVAKVIGNGTAVPGTPLDRISEEAAAQIDGADLCIAKGQGNFESLRGCGKNIYYLFLCKCELFVRKFQAERFTSVLSNEKRIMQYA